MGRQRASSRAFSIRRTSSASSFGVVSRSARVMASIAGERFPYPKASAMAPSVAPVLRSSSAFCWCSAAAILAGVALSMYPRVRMPIPKF